VLIYLHFFFTMADEEQRTRYLEFAERFLVPRLDAWRRYLALREAQRAARLEAQKTIIDLQIDEILAEIDTLHRIETREMLALPLCADL
jgi:hypothetical protein